MTLQAFDAADGLHAIARGSNPGMAVTLDNLPALASGLLVPSDADGLFVTGSTKCWRRRGSCKQYRLPRVSKNAIPLW
ncbi:MAG TPA: hypothetical protein VHQ21_07280 [Rhodanobacteraceae bacterium]|nr:hypothetical protein [Rhodanobacteraceae bacterium]